MAKERLITGIDIGSSKISTIIANVTENKISVIGVATVPSKGVRKGVIVDIDEAVEAISQSLEGAERMAGAAISSALITVNGSHITSFNSKGVVAVAHQDAEITPEDISRVTEAAQAISIPNGKEMVHVVPREFVVDSQDGVRDPLGMSGIRLEVETNIIVGSSTAMKNLVKCVQQVGVGAQELVYTALAASDAVMTDTEKELGSILVDIGGGTTSIMVFAGGSPAYSSVIPIGAQNITNDLAIGLRSSLEDAEKIKLKLSESTALLARRNPLLTNWRSGQEEENLESEIDVSGMNFEVDKLPKKLLNDIIKARLVEIFSLVSLEVKKSSWLGNLPAGLVLVGGGANTYGAELAARSVMKLPVRIGYPAGVTGLIEEIGGPDFAAAVGLLVHGSRTVSQSRKFSLAPAGKIPQFFSKIVSWFKSFLP